MKDCIKHIAWLLMALSTLFFSCTRKEMPVPGGEDEVTSVIPYRVTVEQMGQTRATLNGINQYVFQLGDELYITDGTGNIFGFLSLVAGEGATMATFEGELKCINDAEPTSSTVLNATLVGPNDEFHTCQNGKIISNSAASLPKSAYTATLAEAVQKYSEFTGTSTYGSHSFRLEQQMSFLVFSVTFDPAKLPPAKKDGVSVTITSLNGEGDEDDFTLYSGGDFIPVTNVEDLQSNFVVALPSTTLYDKSTLSNASVVFTYTDGTVKEAGRWNGITQELAKNNYYNFNKTQLLAECFMIEARQDGTSITFNYTTESHGIRYSTDGENWNDVIENTPISLAHAGDAIWVQGNALKLKKGDNSEVLFTSEGNKLCYIYGDIMTLLWGEGYDPAANSLDSDGPVGSNNRNMFEGLFKNTDYIDIPSGRPLQLPNATTKQCYLSMFEGCTSLTRAPDLPASTVEEGAYQNMFKGCTGLTAAPELPATSVAQNGYNAMFMNCTALASAPTRLAGTTANSCCYSMFEGCTSLTFAPQLAAGTIGTDGYRRMFYGCSSLLAAPDLEAETISTSSYLQMFMGCSSMTSAPLRLPAPELKNSCYQEMFSGCSSLTNVPKLPATNDVVTVPSYCYYRMFLDCRSINRLPVDLPDLPLVKIGASGCREMFKGCTKLVEAPELASLEVVGEYGCNGMFYSCSELTTVPPVLAPLSVPAEAYRDMFRDCPKITETPDIKAEQMGESACRSMFNSCIRLNKINGKLLPGTADGTVDRSGEALASFVYGFMFEGCTSLATVPASLLPAMNLGQDCYWGMFKSSGIKQAPDLPAVTLTTRCYREMFRECKALKGTVYLPAGVLVQDCYDNMFEGASQFNSLICLATSRTPWTDDGGTGANDLRPSCNDWLKNTKSTGTFYYASGFCIKNGEAPASDPGWLYPSTSGIRSGWTCMEFHLDPIFPPDNPFNPEEDL